MTLVKGWRSFLRWWSTWLVLIGSSAAAFAPQLSEALIYAWQIVPVDIKSTFPPHVVQWIGYAIALAGIPAKLIRQPKLHETAERTDKPESRDSDVEKRGRR